MNEFGDLAGAVGRTAGLVVVVAPAALARGTALGGWPLGGGDELEAELVPLRKSEAEGKVSIAALERELAQFRE
ncbi:MAG: hypothetical protein IID55_07910, partial [Proteobacteria bacterium]|nr:hypothetical protein [Pseudomonadota bacterium]